MTSSHRPPISLIAQGASIQHLPLTDPHTQKTYDIVLGFPSERYYETHNGPYFGETIGRVANRISGAKINSLNGKSYELAKNNGENSLHGGVKGWGKKKWEGPFEVKRRTVKETGKTEEGDEEAVLFKYLSADGDEGYPGTVETRVWYTPRYEKDTASGIEKTVLGMEYEVEFVGEDEGVQETVVNMTNHSYFNLCPGSSTIAGTTATLQSTNYLPLTDSSVPLGNIAKYPNLSPGTPFTLGESEPDIDDCFIMPQYSSDAAPSTIPIDTRSLPLHLLASFSHPGTKIRLEVWSTEPAFQFYTGRFIDVPEIREKDGQGNERVVVKGYGQRAGFCVEPSRFVDAVNREEWAGMVKLRRGEKYGCRILYRAWIE